MTDVGKADDKAKGTAGDRRQGDDRRKTKPAADADAGRRDDDQTKGKKAPEETTFGQEIFGEDD
jgi:hypothetical protein